MAERKQINFTVVPDAPGDAPRFYSNFCALSHTPYDFTLTFCEVLPPTESDVRRAETNQQLRGTFLKLFQPVGLRFLPVLRKLMPDLAEEEVLWRLHFVIGSLAHTLICTQLEEPLMGKLVRGEHLAESLVQFSAAGMAARVPAPVAVPKS